MFREIFLVGRNTSDYKFREIHKSHPQIAKFECDTIYVSEFSRSRSSNDI